MNFSAGESRVPAAVGLSLTDDTLSVELSDGSTLTVPLARFPRLLHASTKERLDWRLIGMGEGIHWSAIDEDISVESRIADRPSAESAKSLGAKSLGDWLSRRSI